MSSVMLGPDRSICGVREANAAASRDRGSDIDSCRGEVVAQSWGREEPRTAAREAVGGNSTSTSVTEFDNQSLPRDSGDRQCLSCWTQARPLVGCGCL
ncbi:hypothetical protein C8Q78DRAFT_1009689 [Trametes maxima]|nr:hypothetical protein C8Q78DRAFT_1009689 [Trametes maxima]